MDRRASPLNQAQRAFSPRAWGWTGPPSPPPGEVTVFPTRVGVDRRQPRRGGGLPRFPHARGGGPFFEGLKVIRDPFSPRAWGWTGAIVAKAKSLSVFPTRVGVDRHIPRAPLAWFVFPTRVGVDRSGAQLHSPPRSFPHARGGGPPPPSRFWRVGQFSPRAWGWTGSQRYSRKTRCVFPTRVGVDRGGRGRSFAFRRFPHARGGGPWAQ